MTGSRQPPGHACMPVASGEGRSYCHLRHRTVSASFWGAVSPPPCWCLQAVLPELHRMSLHGRQVSSTASWGLRRRSCSLAPAILCPTMASQILSLLHACVVAHNLQGERGQPRTHGLGPTTVAHVCAVHMCSSCKSDPGFWGGLSRFGRDGFVYASPRHCGLLLLFPRLVVVIVSAPRLPNKSNEGFGGIGDCRRCGAHPRAPRCRWVLATPVSRRCSVSWWGITRGGDL